MELLLNEVDLGRLIADLTPPGECFKLEVAAIGTRQDEAWYKVCLNERQVKKLLAALPVEALKNRYNSR